MEVEVAVPLGGKVVEDGEAGIETEITELVGKAVARLYQGPLRELERA